MLYDMNAECSSQAITQTALLLSFWTPPGDLRGRKPNTSWLAIAIHEARAEDAHIYHYGYDCKYGKKPPTLWKRIWWCCIIRDRILSLGVRRSPQITSDDFDFDSCEPLAVSDFKGEIENSSTYTMETRTLLAHMLLRIAKLCAILTRLQSLPSWLEAPRDKDADQLISCMGHVRRVKASLRKWSEETDAEFSSCLQNGKLAGSADTQSKAVAVHLHTMYMYY
jgi:hypothetical protein